MMRRAKPGLRSSSANTVCFAMCSTSESASAFAPTMQGFSRNMTASPKLRPAPMMSVTRSARRVELAVRAIRPCTTAKKPVEGSPWRKSVSPRRSRRRVVPAARRASSSRFRPSNSGKWARNEPTSGSRARLEALPAGMIEVLAVGVERFRYALGARATGLVFHLAFHRLGAGHQLGDHDVQLFVGRGLQLAVLHDGRYFAGDLGSERLVLPGRRFVCMDCFHVLCERAADVLHALTQRRVGRPLLPLVENQFRFASRMAMIVRRLTVDGRPREYERDRQCEHGLPDASCRHGESPYRLSACAGSKEIERRTGQAFERAAQTLMTAKNERPRLRRGLGARSLGQRLIGAYSKRGGSRCEACDRSGIPTGRRESRLLLPLFGGRCRLEFNVAARTRRTLMQINPADRPAAGAKESGSTPP